jgi:hypothetical protein
VREVRIGVAMRETVVHERPEYVREARMGERDAKICERGLNGRRRERDHYSQARMGERDIHGEARIYVREVRMDLATKEAVIHREARIGERGRYSERPEWAREAFVHIGVGRGWGAK